MKTDDKKLIESLRCYIKWTVRVCVIIMVVCSGVAESDIHASSSPEPVASPSPGMFPIVASSVYDSEKGPQSGDIDGVRDCGFNLCLQFSSIERYEKLLGFLDGSGVKLLMNSQSFRFSSKDSDDQWRKDISSLVNKFGDNPNVAGWQFYDEPQWNHLSQLSEKYKWLREEDNTRFILLNLVGQLHKTFTGPCKSLEEYLDSIQREFDLDVWSSDYYPVYIKEGKLHVNYELYYEDLRTFSSKAKETGKPMWSYCQTMSYSAKNITRPESTEPYLRFQAFSSLAYGAQGLVYWTYRLRRSNADETYLSALVDLDGNRTRGWYAARDVNMQIRALTPVFLGARMVDCRHTGNIQLRGRVKSVEDFGPLQLLTGGDKGVLVSHLQNGDKNYLLIVSHDVEKKQKINLKLKPGIRANRLKVDSGRIKKTNLKAGVNITLAPGDYVILEWN